MDIINSLIAGAQKLPHGTPEWVHTIMHDAIQALQTQEAQIANQAFIIRSQQIRDDNLTKELDEAKLEIVSLQNDIEGYQSDLGL